MSEAAQESTQGGSRGARTAARLRSAALEAFGELGWQATRVEDIVQRAGVSHGTFYNYYPNKAQVLEDIVRESQATFVLLANEHWHASDVRGALERVIGGFLEHYQRDATIMRTWLQAAREEPAFGQLYLASRALFVERVAENVAATVAASGRRQTLPASTVASTLVAMVEHFAYCWIILGEPHEPEDVLAAVVLVWGSTLNTLAGFPVVRLESQRPRQ